MSAPIEPYIMWRPSLKYYACNECRGNSVGYYINEHRWWSRLCKECMQKAKDKYETQTGKKVGESRKASLEGL
jgi:hypothetical protein